MPESKELHQKVDEILRHVQSMDGQMSWLIRSNDSGLRTLFLEYFETHTVSAKVFLAIDGKRRVGILSKYLDIVQPSVSRSISELGKMGLIDLVKRGLYRKNKIDLILGISDELRKNEEYADIK
jgi:DNA-binding transcriptional ArsR family regulator